MLQNAKNGDMTYRTCILVSLLLCFAGPTLRAETNPRQAVEVMSFNIRYGLADDGDDSWPHRKKMVMEVIRKNSPDLVGLQEALQFQLDAILEAFPEYASSGEERDGNGKGEYSAILYRRDRFEVLDEGTFWYSDTPEVPSAHWGNSHLRICSWARLRDKVGGHAFFLYNTHWDHRSQPSREKSALLLAERIHNRPHPEPVIAMGDFNAGEDNPAIAYLKGCQSPLGKTPIPLADSFRVKHPDETLVRTHNGFKGLTEGDKIDYVFVSKEWHTEEAEIIRYAEDGHTPSDHFPVTARVHLLPRQ
jgi:endonuclease/exonuclease/phosphatase family metal-dependent hydrolase